MFFERRKIARYTVSWPASLEVLERNPVSVRIREISLDGISIVCDDLLDTGKRCDVTFTVPHPRGELGREITARCEVVRAALSHDQNYHQVGLKFIALADVDSHALSVFIEHLAQLK